MGLLINLLPHNLPAITREEIIAELFKAVELAFAFPAPTFADLSYEDRLRTFALFTSQQAKRALRSRRRVSTIKTLLYQNAYPLGLKIRQWLAVDTMPEVMELGQILYQAIGVELAGDPQGSITVSRCYFSQFYTAPVCDLISALDGGVFSGLSGGARLAFSQRITEGKPCCKAVLQLSRKSD